MKFVTKILASVAVASFAVAQPAAAATRSYESLPQSGLNQPLGIDRTGAVTADAEHLHGAPFLPILLIFGVLLAIFAVTGVFDNGKDSTG